MPALIEQYFPDLSEIQRSRFDSLEPFYREWNEKINLISRKDMDQFMLHHVLHSLTLGRFMNFAPGTEILDLGTGGGFPGIPLAILWPEVRFHLIDGTGKKIKVVEAAVQHLGLENVTASQIRVEDLGTQYDYVVARAVTNLADLLRLSRKRIRTRHINARPNGLIAYKGYPLKEEHKTIKNVPHELFMIHDFFDEEYFRGKCIVYIPVY